MMIIYGTWWLKGKMMITYDDDAIYVICWWLYMVPINKMMMTMMTEVSSGSESRHSWPVSSNIAGNSIIEFDGFFR